MANSSTPRPPRTFPFPALTVVDLEDREDDGTGEAGKDPAWSPGDGRYIAYTSGAFRRGRGDLGHRNLRGPIREKSPTEGFRHQVTRRQGLFYHSHENNKLMSTDPFAGRSGGHSQGDHGHGIRVSAHLRAT